MAEAKGIISAAMILTMLNRNPAFQIFAVLSFYIWLAGQTIPPVSVSTGGKALEDLSIETTKFMLGMSQYIADFILPTVNVYDLVSNPASAAGALIAYLAALAVYLVFAIEVTNKREFFYGTN